MYVELNGKEDLDYEDVIASDEPTGEEAVVAVTLGTRPNNWFFNGWFAFCLFGPFVPESDRISLIQEPGSTSNDNNIKNGRNEQRKGGKAEESLVRNNDKDIKRGRSLQMELGIAELEMKQESLEGQKKDRIVIGLNCIVQSCQRNLDRAEARANIFCPDYDETNSFWMIVESCEKELEKVESELREALDISQVPKKRKNIS